MVVRSRGSFREVRGSGAVRESKWFLGAGDDVREVEDKSWAEAGFGLWKCYPGIRNLANVNHWLREIFFTNHKWYRAAYMLRNLNIRPQRTLSTQLYKLETEQLSSPPYPVHSLHQSVSLPVFLIHVYFYPVSPNHWKSRLLDSMQKHLPLF